MILCKEAACRSYSCFSFFFPFLLLTAHLTWTAPFSSWFIVYRSKGRADGLPANVLICHKGVGVKEVINLIKKKYFKLRKMKNQSSVWFGQTLKLLDRLLAVILHLYLYSLLLKLWWQVKCIWQKFKSYVAWIIPIIQ